MENLNDGFDFGPAEFANKKLVPQQSWKPGHTIILAVIAGAVGITWALVFWHVKLKQYKLASIKSSGPEDKKRNTEIDETTTSI